jgi:hypothetical protein
MFLTTGARPNGTAPFSFLIFELRVFIKEFAAKASEFFNHFQIEKFTELSYT